MKYIIPLLFALIPFASNAQKQDIFTIQGIVKSKQAPRKAYISYASAGQQIVDSTDIKAGKFQFAGAVGAPIMARLFFDYSGKGYTDADNKKDFKVVYLEPLVINVQTVDSLKRATVTGSILNDDYRKYLGMADSMDAIIIDLRKAAATDASIRANFRSSIQVLENKKMMEFKSYATNNPNSFFSLNALTYLLNVNINANEVEKIFNTISETQKTTPTGQQLKKRLYFTKLTSEGSPAIEFTQNDVNNKPVKVSDFRGKYLLIDFWASWCGPCRMENPNLVKAYQKYNDKGFEILGVSLDNEGKKADWVKAIEVDGLLWTQVSDLKGWKNEAAVLYGIPSVPSSYLIDPEGTIIARNLRGKQLDDKLEELLGK